MSVKFETDKLPIEGERTDPSGGNRAPELGGILETALYTEDLPAAERFYSGVLGLKKILDVPGRQLVFRCQDSVLLIFNPQKTATERLAINGGDIPLHGARGAGHAAFQVAQDDMKAWRARFEAAGVPIESEVIWPNSAHSLYFRDPAGNSLELVTPDIWEGQE